MILRQNIIAHSTDAVTEYPDPQAFLNSLPDYLKIESQLPEGLGMISIGQDAPDQQYQDIPWLQLDDNNNPIALKYYNGVEWAEVRPYRAIQAPYEGLLVQYGQISYTHKSANSDVWIDSMTLTQNNGQIGQFLFPEQFKAGTSVHVQITPLKSSIHRENAKKITGEADADADDKQKAFINGIRDVDWCLGENVDHVGFNVNVKTSDAVPSGYTFTFNWMAMGEKA
jgi:hypothetical protein